MQMSSLVEIWESDGLGEPLIHERLHGRPGLHIVGIHVRAVVALVRISFNHLHF